MIKLGDDKPKLNSMGLEVKESTYMIQRKKSLFVTLANIFRGDMAMGLAGIFTLILISYSFFIYSRFVAFHYMALIFVIFFMFWIALTEDARVKYKLISLIVIFVLIIVYITL